MQVFRSSPSSQKVNAPATELTSAGACQKEMNTTLFDEAVHLIEKVRQALDFIDNNHSILRSDFLRDAPGAVTES